MITYILIKPKAFQYHIQVNILVNKAVSNRCQQCKIKFITCILFIVFHYIDYKVEIS